MYGYTSVKYKVRSDNSVLKKISVHDIEMILRCECKCPLYVMCLVCFSRNCYGCSMTWVTWTGEIAFDS